MPVQYDEDNFYTEEEAIHYLNVSPARFEAIKLMRIPGKPPKLVLRPHTLPGHGDTVFYSEDQLKAIRPI